MQNASRASILKWLQALKIPLQRIEDVGKGTALCMVLRLLDSSFPKFREDPQTKNDYLGNLKLVQQYFERKSVKLYFPIDRMINLKMQDNLEVVQWFYRYWAREAMAQEDEAQTSCTGGGRAEQPPSRSEPPGRIERGVPAIQTSTVCHLDGQSPEELKNEVAEMENAIAQKQSQVEKIRECARIFQSERDFYFGKLLMIEKLLKDDSYELTAETKREILRMMYQN